MTTTQNENTVDLELESTLQKAWNKAIECLVDGLTDNEAMYEIREAGGARLTPQDISNVIGAVYADEYWNVTYMDSAKLAKRLVQSGIVTEPKASECASKTVAQWRGILSRKFTNDTGNIPAGKPGEQLWTSIDIVCNQDSELLPVQLIKGWNNTFWNTPQVGLNYVYTRVQNLAFFGLITPTVTMWYAAGGFNQPPSAWQQLFTAADSAPVGDVILINGEAGPMSKGERGSSVAFLLDPPNADHICVIGIAKYESFEKNDPKDIPLTNWDSQFWIKHNGAAAWHNMDPQKNIESTLDFYNQDNSSENFIFRVQCAHVPIGSKISLNIADKTVNLNTGLIDITHQSLQFEKSITVPPNYHGKLMVRMEGPDGKMLPGNAAVEITMDWLLKKDHNRYNDAATQLNAVKEVLNGNDIRLSLGSFTLIGGADK